NRRRAQLQVCLLANVLLPALLAADSYGPFHDFRQVDPPAAFISWSTSCRAIQKTLAAGLRWGSSLPSGNRAVLLSPKPTSWSRMKQRAAVRSKSPRFEKATWFMGGGNWRGAHAKSLGPKAATVLCDVVQRHPDDAMGQAWQAMAKVPAHAAVPALIQL